MASQIAELTGRVVLRLEPANSLLGIDPLPARTPASWFARRFPSQADRYGCPFLELRRYNEEANQTTILALHLNLNFFASILNDTQLGHSTVYYEPEEQWYYLEPQDGRYHPTSEAKLINLLSGLLTRCAQEMPPEVDIYPLFVTFQEPEFLKTIVKTARSVLAADATFFSPTSQQLRIEGPELNHQLARRFVLKAMKPAPESIITVHECYRRFEQYCAEEELEAVPMRYFKRFAIEIVREEYGVGFRSDLKNSAGQYLRGWKGLALG